MTYLITGNLGYVGPVLTEYLKKRYPERKIIGYDLGLFANLITGVNYNPGISKKKVSREKNYWL